MAAISKREGSRDGSSIGEGGERMEGSSNVASNLIKK